MNLCDQSGAPFLGATFQAAVAAFDDTTSDFYTDIGKKCAEELFNPVGQASLGRMVPKARVIVVTLVVSYRYRRHTERTWDSDVADRGELDACTVQDRAARNYFKTGIVRLICKMRDDASEHKA
jgi:hypothetical protein